MKKKILVLVVLIVSFSGIVSATDYYVKNGGNDNLDGFSDATAWATIAKVQATVTSGDTVYFRSQDAWSDVSPVLTTTAGVTYDGSTYGTGTRASFVSAGDYNGGFNDGGVVEINSNSVLFKGFDVNGDNYGTQGISIGVYYALDLSDITIDNCVVYNIGDTTYAHTGIQVTPMAPSGAQTFSNITIKNSIVHDIDYSGINLYATWIRPGAKIDTALIQNNTVYNTGRISGGEGVYIKDDVDNVIVEFCDLYNNLHGIHIETYDDVAVGDPNNFIVRYNLIHENIGGIDFMNRHKTIDGVFYNNLILNNGKAPNTYGSDLSINPADWGTSVVSFYNNIFYNTASTATDTSSVRFSNWGVLTGTPTFEFKNNIFYTGDYLAFEICRDDPGCTWDSITHSNNLIYRSSGAADAHLRFWKYEADEFTYNRSEVISDWEPSAQNTDPLFVNPEEGDFRLQAGSPAIDAGIDVDLTIDFEGNPVPQGVAPDIGAYEYLSGEPPTCTGTCMSNQCGTYTDCTSLTGECTTGYCCSGTCTTSGTCSSGADNNPINGVVSITELMNYISQWKSGSVTITELMIGIGEWKNGC